MALNAAIAEDIKVKQNEIVSIQTQIEFNQQVAEDNSIIPRLNGHINLIIGNHDRKNLRQGYMLYFDMVVPQLQIEIEDNSIYLNHYPFLCYGGSYRGVWQLFGHVHSGPQADGLDISRLRVLLPTQYDVGVDNNNFIPISYREVKEKIESQKNESLDRTVSR